MTDFLITPFTKEYEQQVIDLIVGIQSGEFGVKITAADQPDLKIISEFYQKGSGNFWIALQDDEVLGTISLTDIGNSQVGLRKMFVKQGHLGKPLNIGQKLMDTTFTWCNEHSIKQIFLGTVPTYYAAHRFYEKNGFKRLEKSDLPKAFHLMDADKWFYYKNL
ncbi:MAG: GNAT family N-acetyltransferase [Proteobacteria bacterium]|nr:GNAT family N-acetyltransferase [Pseudomonadota bacterium]